MVAYYIVCVLQYLFLLWPPAHIFKEHSLKIQLILMVLFFLNRMYPYFTFCFKAIAQNEIEKAKKDLKLGM